MSRSASLCIALLLMAAFPLASQQHSYTPPPGAWEQRAPTAVGLDSALVAGAVEFALASETPWSRDLHAQIARNVAREPYPAILGPILNREGPSGVILRHGYLVATWGDIERVDMTFSVAKSYLSAVAGVAYDRGLIPDVHAPVRNLVDDDGFDGARNSQITWHQLLNQTSEWEGVLWDKPDVADRRRGQDRELSQPGTFWEYNDVRVNRLALALLRVFRQPLPEILREAIMDPVGASDTWVWHGYRNAHVTIDGREMQSVSGGGHWGGGVWASTLDHARFGLLFLRRGWWGDREIISERWIDMSVTPTEIHPIYGYMWWLNAEPERQSYRSATPQSYFARGAGGNVIWVCPEYDMVVVVRWMDTSKVDEFIGRVIDAIQ